MNVTFSQSEVADPYSLYAEMLHEHPVYRDDANNIWAVYPHAECVQVLHSAVAEIPQPGDTHTATMNEYTRTVASHLIRLRNGPTHERFRELTVPLFESIRPVDISKLLDRLIGTGRDADTLDWVEGVCKKLPALTVLRGFSFPQDDIDIILENVGQLVRIMAPAKSESVIREINAATEEVFPRVERHLANIIKPDVLASSQLGEIEENELMNTLVSNFIGFLIQSYDAGRGLLSNALLQVLQQRDLHDGDSMNGDDVRRCVVETLRFDPPIQNTRRILAEDMEVGGECIEAGQTVLIVLAAANRDPLVFDRPDEFDPSRENNGDHLTFGSGAHHCLAEHFMVDLSAQTLSHLLSKYPRARLDGRPIAYEPLINARLPEELHLTFAQ